MSKSGKKRGPTRRNAHSDRRTETLAARCWTSPTPEVEDSRIRVLEQTIEHYLPEAARMINDCNEGLGPDIVMLHQDAVDVGFHTAAYTLLGMLIKYAGLRGVPVQIIGNNKETF